MVECSASPVNNQFSTLKVDTMSNYRTVHVRISSHSSEGTELNHLTLTVLVTTTDALQHFETG